MTRFETTSGRKSRGKQTILKGEEMAGISRRGFLSLAATGAGTAAFLGMTGCSAGKSAGDASKSEAAPTAADWYGVDPEIDESAIDQKETDLLIVGAGTAGMMAAATAADSGIDFILCEKTVAVQTTRHWVGGVNTKWHKEAGVEIDEGKLLNELTRYASGRCDQQVWKVWIHESPETLEYLDGIMKPAGFSCFLDTEDYDHETGGTYYYTPPTQHMWYDKAAGGPSAAAGVASSTSRNEVLKAYIEGKGNEILFEHKLVKLDRSDNGKVTGGVFETNDGYVRINASKGVILATGGYAANPEMIKARNPMVPNTVTMAQFSPNCTGEGQSAAVRIGAAVDDSPASMVFDRGYIAPGDDAGYVGEGENATFRTASTSGIFLGSQPFMKVNRHGVRFFNESAPYDWSANAASKQPGGVWCSIFDSKASEDSVKFKVVGCAKLGTLKLQKAPVEESFKDFFEQGYLFKADTLEELADKLGFEGDDKDALLAQVERYNELYDAGVDEDFGKESFRLSRIDTPPYYGFWCGGSLLTTIDGLRINADMQVLDADGNVIDGLYAAGDCSGSLYNSNYPEYIVGNACGRSLTFARHAVLKIADAI